MAQVAVGIEAMPAFVVEKNIGFGKRFSVCCEADEFFEGKRVEQYPKRVGHVPELEIIKLLPYVDCKARTQRHNPAVVIDWVITMGNRYLGCKVHFFKFQSRKVTKFEMQKWQSLMDNFAIYKLCYYFTNSPAFESASAMPAGFLPPAVAKNG